MSENPTWNDASRADLRETLRGSILGEIRLASSDHDTILLSCRETYIEDECPESERNEFIRFATQELEDAAAKYAAEQASWPPETDCDRLDRVEADLRERGILFWQLSPCCDSCTGAELPERMEEIDQQEPGFRDRVRGYAFYIDQTMAEMLAESTQLSIYLAYGWVPPGTSEVTPAVHEQNALGIAHEVCACLREHGFEPEWNGDFSRKIGVHLNWQRRTRLL